MATTFATEKQAEAIKQKMAEIRTELPYEVDEARARVRQLSDWKYHVARRPLPILAAAAVLGYLAVPAKRTPERIVISGDSIGGGARDRSPAPAKRGLVGGIAGALATMAIRQGTSLAADQLSRFLSKRGES